MVKIIRNSGSLNFYSTMNGEWFVCLCVYVCVYVVCLCVCERGFNLPGHQSNRPFFRWSSRIYRRFCSLCFLSRWTSDKCGRRSSGKVVTAPYALFFFSCPLACVTKVFERFDHCAGLNGWLAPSGVASMADRLALCSIAGDTGVWHELFVICKILLSWQQSSMRMLASF